LEGLPDWGIVVEKKGGAQRLGVVRALGPNQRGGRKVKTCRKHPRSLG